MTKKEIQKELMKLGIEVTLRPRKATLLWMLEEARKEPSKVTFMDDIAEQCDPKKKDGFLDSVGAFAVLTLVFGFFAIIALEFVSFWSDIPLAHLIGSIAVFFLLFGIPLVVYYWEKK